MHAVMARALIHDLDNVERLERLIATAERRRNKLLGEIDARRAGLARRLHDATQLTIEGGEVI